MPQGVVQWAGVSFMSLNDLLVLTAVAYPALLVALLLGTTALVSMCLTTEPAEEAANEEAQPGVSPPSSAVWDPTRDPMYDPPVLSKDRFSQSSKDIYNCWVVFCCLIPSWMVFGIPVAMLALARPYPQEVFAALTLLTSACIFTNGIYMAIFAGIAILKMRQCMSADAACIIKDCPSEEVGRVKHWVILPQYKEDVEIVALALNSISASTLARESICLVLGMENREGEEARRKAKQLRERFDDKFCEILESYHPTDLPNDPPGKASNLAWAFRHLMQHLSQTDTDMSKVILTVADADSEFDAGYFETLTHNFLTAGAEQRDLRIWQSPVFHLKNYHRQPLPVIVGTMFTCMQELAALSDPNAVRFPYSTYSLSLSLARKVGGWDADWIAEDYHMGIKCFLLTLGRLTIEPIMLPTVNYTPEDETWLGTVLARWTQAKRHALGFSDMSYYFMMLPLVFSYAASRESSVESLQAFWSMATYGVTLLIRLINIHVIIGVLSTYSALTSLLRVAMLVLIAADRNINFLFTRTDFCPQLLMSSGLFCTILVSILFICVYNLMVSRIEEPRPINSSLIHFARNALSILVCGPCYFLGLGFCIWKAAWSVLSFRSFEYEVAPKPNLSRQLAAGGKDPPAQKTR